MEGEAAAAAAASDKKLGQGDRQSEEAGEDAQPKADTGQARTLNDHYGFGTTPVSSRVIPPPASTELIVGGEGGAMNVLDVAGESETAQNPPETPMPFVVAGEGSTKDDGRDAVKETGGANTGTAASPVLSTTSATHRGSQQHPNPWSDHVVNASSIPAASTSGNAKSQRWGTPTSMGEGGVVVVGDGFPFPARTPTPTTTTAPSIPAGRPATTKSISGVSVPVPVPVPALVPRSGGGSGWPESPDPAHTILALRAAVGQELYATGERLLRCVEADHREIHGRPYRPMPITGAERDQFHACLTDAARGSLRRSVLNFLQVQESCRALAVERDPYGAGSRDGKRQVEHSRGRRGTKDGGGAIGGGDGRGGDDSGVSDARGKKSKDKRRIVERQQGELYSLATGPISSPAEKSRAARCERKARVCVCYALCLACLEVHRKVHIS